MTTDSIEGKMIINRPMDMNGPPEDWKFFDLRGDKDKNELGSNLTELSAAGHFFDRGFMAHRDWIAHVSRWFAVARKIRMKKDKLLDVGCGKLGLPYTLNQCRRQPAEYWGLDLRALENWGKSTNWKTPTNLVRMDLILDDPTDLLGWPEDGFDLVTCFEVLEHVPRANAAQLVQNLYDWTKPGGSCLLSTPNHGTSTSVAKNHIGPDGEIREWTYQDKLGLIEDAGFELEGAYGTFIRLDQLPVEITENKELMAAKEFLHGDWFSVMAAAAYPEQANNAVFYLRRPK